MGRRTIKNQLRHVVCERKRLGHSKRGEKKNGVEVEKFLYSHNSTKKMFALANKLGDWMRDKHPEVKWVKDITPKHIQEFVDDNRDNWHGQTCKEMESRIHKLGGMIGETFHVKCDYSSVRVENTDKSSELVPLRAMTHEDFRKLSDQLLSGKSSARYIPEITARIGTRSEETRSITSRDIDLVNKVVHITNAKGGRNRSVPIRDKDVIFFRELRDYMEQNGWENACNGITENSCNKAIRAAMRECGISDKYRQSIHAIRKMYAHERMAELLRPGDRSWRDAWCVVQGELGHGNKFRGDLVHRYLGE